MTVQGKKFVFGISLPELLVIFVVVLVVVGPRKLPVLASQLGRWLAEFRKASDSVRREFYNSVYTPIQESKLHLESTTKALITDRPDAAANVPPSPSSSTTTTATTPNATEAVPAPNPPSPEKPS